MDIYQTVRDRLEASGADVASIGKSEFGNDILCAHAGSYDGKQILVTAGIHARECYTALAVLRQAGGFAGDGGAYFIPLVNPDGALFFENGETFGSEVLERFMAFRRVWKANGRGVDLNCNFDANWGTGKGNKRFVYAHGYIGEYPQSARETAALAEFTERTAPSFTVSYHCMGGELYWEFFQRGARKKRDKKLAAAVAKHIGVKRVDGDLDSAGGFKDFCVMRLGIPSVTVELIKHGSHPFAPTDFAGEAETNADLPAFILRLLNEEN